MITVSAVNSDSYLLQLDNESPIPVTIKYLQDNIPIWLAEGQEVRFTDIASQILGGELVAQDIIALARED